MTTVVSPHSLTGRPTQSFLPSDELTTLLDAMRAGQPWRDALRRRESSAAAVGTNAFSSRAKAGFYLMLPVPSDGLAIDLGAGSGVIAETLASRFRRVIAVDPDARWCEFMRRRFAEDRLSIEVANASALALPADVKDADLVVMNEVLEWLPVGGDPAATRGRPWSVQLAALRGARKVLRRGGRIGIAVANRWFHENFRGASPHGEPAYAAVLPRAIASAMARAQRGEPYRTWIYGAGGYRRLLRAAGFVNVEVRWAVPNCREPVSVGALGRAGLLRNRVHSFYISGDCP